VRTDRRGTDGFGRRPQPEEPNEAELETVPNDPQRLPEIRPGLSDISSFVGMVAERIARLANAEKRRQSAGTRR
jgi:hypothetical protein